MQISFLTIAILQAVSASLIEVIEFPKNNAANRPDLARIDIEKMVLERFTLCIRFKTFYRYYKVRVKSRLYAALANL